MASGEWGNPDTKTFDRYNLRWATYGERRVHVHKLIWHITERLFTAMGQMNVPMGTLAELDDPLKRGFILVLSDDDQKQIVPQLADVSMTYVDGVFMFVGTAAQAETISKQLGALADVGVDGDDEDTIEPEVSVDKLPEPWSGGLKYGDRGDLVLFVQALMNAPQTGKFDSKTVVAMRDWQSRHGVLVTSELDDDTWTTIIPARIGWLRPGATGHQVKVIQAGFKARGYYDAPITGIWGKETSQALRKFQADYRIHPRLRIGNPEWSALFNRRANEHEKVTPAQ